MTISMHSLCAYNVFMILYNAFYEPYVGSRTPSLIGLLGSTFPLSVKGIWNTLAVNFPASTDLDN